MILGSIGRFISLIQIFLIKVSLDSLIKVSIAKNNKNNKSINDIIVVIREIFIIIV